MKDAVLGEQVANALPVARIPGVDHVLDNDDLGVSGHMVLLRAVRGRARWRGGCRLTGNRPASQQDPDSNLPQPMRHLPIPLLRWFSETKMLSSQNLHK